VDILTHESIDYLVLYDAYSYWIKLFVLKSKSAASIISICKAVFARLGVPQEIVSDNIPFASHEYADFSYKWGFTPAHTSPKYAQSNGLAEKGVSIAKNLLRKNSDISVGLLQYCNVPIPGLNYSPSQLISGRVLRTKLTVGEEVLQPKTPDVNHSRCVSGKSKSFTTTEPQKSSLPFTLAMMFTFDENSPMQNHKKVK
jgi:hypothetical protein